MESRDELKGALQIDNTPPWRRSVLFMVVCSTNVGAPYVVGAGIVVVVISTSFKRYR